MKKIVQRNKALLRPLVVLLLGFFIGGTGSAQTWDFIGSPNFSSTEANWQDMAFSSTGEPYVVYHNLLDSTITVQKYNGTSWQTVGSPGFAFTANIQSSLALDTMDTPHVAFVDNGAVSVMQFDGLDWVYVGTPGFLTSFEPPSLTFFNNVPFVAAADENVGAAPSVYLYFNNNWIPFGSTGFFPGQVTDVHLDISDDGIPFVAFIDQDSLAANVWTYDLGLDTWAAVGFPYFITQIDHLAFSLSDNDIPYVAFQDNLNSNILSVMNYDGFGWNYVGAQNVSTAVAEYPSLAFDNNEPYVAYNDGANSFGMTLKKYDGANWIAVGPEGFTPGEVFYSSLAFYDGAPYVAFKDVANDSGTSVMKSFLTFSGPGGNLTDNTGSLPCAANEFVVNVSGVGGATATLDRVNIDITHTYDADLEIFLTSPNGTTIILSQSNGGEFDNYTATEFSDTGVDGPITNGAAPFTGSFIPEEPLSTFSGECFDGDWIISVCDNAAQDTGTINLWSLTFTAGTDCTSFITTWETTTPNESIEVPTFGTGAGYTIDWGDGATDAGLTGPSTHSYTTPGFHTVRISGELSNISFQNNGDSDKIRTVEQWGNTAWTTFANSFRACSNFVFNAVDVPDLTNVTSIERAFQDCSNFNSDISAWDVSSITDMRNVFNGATSFNQPMNSWNVSNATDMEGMFNGASSFNQPLDSWEVSNVMDMQFMFNSTFSFNQPLNAWDVSSVTDMSTMFFNNQVFNQPLDMWDVSSVTDMSDMLRSATAFDQNLGDWNLASLNTANFMIALSGMSIQNYDNTLIGWANGPSIPFGLGIIPAGLQYCMGGTARTSLIDDHGWSIIGDTDGCMTLTCPITNIEAACQTQAAIDVAFTNWLATVVVANGCNATVVNNATNAPDAMGGEVMVTFTATDECSPALNCTAVFTVEAPSAMAVITPSAAELNCNTVEITLDASSSSSQNSITYLWTGGSTNSSITIGDSGTYSVTITDSQNGCSDTESILITEDTNLPTAQILSFSTNLTCDFPSILLDGSFSSSQNGQEAYLWSDGSMGETYEVFAAGTYGLTVTDMVNGCIDTTSIIIGDVSDFDPNAMITASTTQLDCNTSTILLEGSGQALGGGGSGGSSNYAWNTGALSSSISVSTPGDYALTITDIFSGCSSEASITITENITPPIAMIDALSTQLDCSTTTITLDASSSIVQGTLIYSWTGGSTDSILNVNTAGAYSVTVTDSQNGCTSVDAITITENTTLPTATINSPSGTQLDCISGSITIDASSSTGQGSLSYLWTGGSTSATLNVGTAGTYTVTVTDSQNGCTATDAITITQDANVPTASIEASGTQLDCTTASILLNASGSTGQNALTYLWTGGSTTTTLNVTTAGTYSVTVTDSQNGCTSVDMITITQDGNIPAAVIAAPFSQLDCNIANILLDASGSMGQNSLTYLWTGGSTAATLNVNTAGAYSVTITDSQNGCTSVDAITITENTTLPTAIINSPSGTQLDCISGSITIDASGSTGQGTLSYLWTGGSTSATLNVGTAGAYTVTVTDSQNGCTATDVITITQDANVPTASVEVSGTQLDCNVASILLDASGSMGQNSLTYLWTGGSTAATLNVNTAGAYSVTVTDSQNGCTSVDAITITENTTLPTATINSPSGTQLDCISGSITIDASSSTGQGTLSYLWTGGSTSATLSVGTAGTYTVTVTDGQNGCTATDAITITQDANVPTASIDASGTQLDCTTASILLDASGSIGQNALTYLWTGGSTTTTLNVTTAGTYSVTVTDSQNGCTSVDMITITQDGNIPTAVITAPFSQLDCNVANILLDASGSMGQNPLTYLWTGGSTAATLNVTTAGAYSVTVTDSQNGCTAVDDITIIENTTLPTATINSPSGTQIDCITGSITLDASSSTGQGTLNYEWTDGSTASTLIVGTAGNYFVTVTDGQNGCTVVDSITITQDADVPVAVISLPVTTVLDCNTMMITLDAGTSTGQGALSYAWTGGSTGSTLEVVNPGDYFVTITDTGNSCTAITSITITEDESPPTSSIASPTTQLDCATLDITLDASASIGQGTLIYAWAGGSTDSTLNVSTAGDYFITITDSQNGCTAVDMITVTLNTAAPTSVINSSTTQLDCSNSNILLDASASNGQGALTYLWTDGSTDPTLNISAIGDYSVTITDAANACTAVSSVSITENFDLPTAIITPPVITLLDCNMNMTTLDASTSTGQGALSYSWTGGTSDATLDVFNAGDYFVTITDGQNGCTAVDVISITEDFMEPTAVVETPFGTQLDCNITQVTLDASNSNGQGTLTYLWTGGSTNPALAVTAAGDYFVTITDGQNGCTVIQSVNVTEFVETAVVTSNAPICLGADLELFNNNINATGWEWEGPDGFTSNMQNPIILSAGTVASGTYFLTVTESTGCTAVGSFNAIVNPLPTVNISGSNEICELDNLTLTEDGGEATTWNWTGPNTFSSDLNSINVDMVTSLAAGLYNLTVTDVNACTSSEQVEVIVNERPNIEIVSSAPICTDEDLELTEVGTGAVTWLWTSPDGSTFATQEVVIASDLVEGGLYTVLGTNAANCSVLAEVDVALVPGQNIASDFLVGSNACTGDSLRFIDYSLYDSTALVSLTWDFGNGDTSTEEDPIYVYENTGFYDISLEILSESCPNVSIVKPISIFACLQEETGLVFAELRPTLNSGQFEITVALQESSDVSLEIYDLSGQLIQSEFYKDISSLEEQFSLENEGLYFIQLSHRFGVETLRTIVIGSGS